MKIVSLGKSIAQSVTDINEDRSLRSGYRRLHIAKAIGWLYATHDYVLVVGDKETDEKMSMTGKEAKERNRKFEDEFWSALSKDKRSRLSVWRFVKP